MFKSVSPSKSTVVRVVAGALGASLIGTMALGADAATSSVPDFMSGNAAWGINSVVFAPVAGEKYVPVWEAPGHPWCGNEVLDHCNKQILPPIGDYTNPILQPWAAAAVKKWDDDILAGKQSFEAMSRCWPGGVPGVLIFAANQFFLQQPKAVTVVYARGPNIRQVYLGAEHAKNLKPSWYGDSTGHYEGDTLVVDTVGMNDKTFVDWFHVPHTTQLHVVERYKVIPTGDIVGNSHNVRKAGPLMNTEITVEDPGTFTVPWKGERNFAKRNVHIGDTVEVCAENNDNNYFHEEETPVPQTETPDF